MANNEGWVNVGDTADTAEFAVESIRRWWNQMGRDRFPGAERLLITADAGGSNGYRLRAWKVELAKLAAETGLDITVCHYPPGTSKWNRIEHRMFSFITMNWRGRPLTTPAHHHRADLGHHHHDRAHHPGRLRPQLVSEGRQDHRQAAGRGPARTPRVPRRVELHHQRSIKRGVSPNPRNSLMSQHDHSIDLNLKTSELAPLYLEPNDKSPRRGAKWQACRESIIDMSAYSFAQGGYHATGLTELCAASGLGKGALYHYIGSKEQLLAAIHDRVMDEIMFGADFVAEAGGTWSSQLVMLGDKLLDVLQRYPDHVWVCLHEFPALTGERAARFRQRRREYELRVERILQAGIDAGEFREVDPRLTAMAWLGMHNYTYLWLKADGRLSARDVAKPFAEIFIQGIGNSTAQRAE